MFNVIPNIYEAARHFRQDNVGVGKDLKKELTKAAYLMVKNYSQNKEKLEENAKKQLKALCSKVIRVVSTKGQVADKFVVALYNGGGFPVVITGTNWGKMRSQIAASAGVKTAAIQTSAPIAEKEPREYTYTHNNEQRYYFIGEPETIMN